MKFRPQSQINVHGALNEINGAFSLLERPCLLSEYMSSTVNTALSSFYYASETTDSGDTLGEYTTGITIITSANDNILNSIDLNSEDLTDTYDYFNVVISDPEAETFCSAVAVLSGGRYDGIVSPTAITLYSYVLSSFSSSVSLLIPCSAG